MSVQKDSSLWVEIFLASKYMNEFFKNSLPKKLKLNSFDYFILLCLINYKDLTFYEINKALPLDVKSLHNKINSLVERGLVERKFSNNNSSVINIEKNTRILIDDLRKNYWINIDKYFEKDEIFELKKLLLKFNRKMRSLLDLDISKSTLKKRIDP